MRFPYLISLLMASLLGVFTTAHAQDFIVTNTLDVPDASPGDGVCNPVNAVPGTCTLRAAVMESNALNNGVHLIALPSGTYALNNVGEDEDDALTGDLDITANIRILNGTSTPPLISGNQTDRIFDVFAGAELELENVTLGLGVANTPSTVRGGAAQVRAGGRLELDRVFITLNLANQGGAIYNDGEVSIQGSELFNNAIVAEQIDPAFSDGAAIFNRGRLLIGRSTIRDNGKIPGFESPLPTTEYAIHSRQGFTDNPQVALSASTLYGNTNGVFSDGVLTSITNSTLVGNNQRGIRFLPDVEAADQVQLNINQTVLYDHLSGDCNDLDSSQPFLNVTANTNASSDESCAFDGPNDFENISHPFFGGAGDNGGMTTTFMPRSNGILVDPAGGSCQLIGNSDQRGESRPVDGDESGDAECDIGAVEFQPGSDPEFFDRVFSDRYELN